MPFSLHKARQIITALFLTITLVIGSHVAAPIAHAQTMAWTDGCVAGPHNDVPTIIGVECLVANILRVAITFIGLAGFVMLLYGSYKFLISGGNNKGMEDAQKTLTFSVVGLVVALSSFLIVRLISEFTGVSSILDFSIRVP